MKAALQISAREFELTEAMEKAVRERAEKLNRFYERVMGCRVVLEAPHQHQQKGVLYNVRVDMTVPGGELVVKREPNEDLYVAIGDAFDTAERQLQEYGEKQRGDVKRHDEAPRGVVTTLFPERGYGFLTDSDGREVYFHKNSVLGDRFKEIEIGTEVRFVEELGEKGPQASTVRL